MLRAVLVLLLAACVPENSPIMSPGAECLQCHNGTLASAWTVAGTVYSTTDAAANEGLQHAEVLITDASGQSDTLTTNSAGNFYLADSLVFPLLVQVQNKNTRMQMMTPLTGGTCNTCHNAPPTAGAPGRIFVPG